MKTLLRFATGVAPIAAFLWSESALWSQVPQVISYQGRLTVSGTNYNGTGHFKFALVDRSGTVTYWSNDGTSSAGSAPASDVALPVSDSLFSAMLGDTNLAHMTRSVPANIFTNADVRLRIWVSDRSTGFQQLTPDQPLGSMGYAMQSAGAAVAYSLAAGVVTNAGTVVQVNTGPGLGGGPITTSGTISIPNSAISNAMLQNPNVTVSAGSGLTGGGSVALGGATTLTANLNHDSTLKGTGGSAPLGLNLANPNTWIGQQSFSNTINGNITGTAVGFTGLLAGDVTGTQTATVISNLNASKIAGLFRWQVATNLAQQANPNTGYIVTNTSQVTVTLPPALGIGDTVAIACPGAGGWKILQNANQSIFAGAFGTLAVGLNWTNRGSIANWRSVASSTDGTKAAAVVNNGQVYVSTDAGVTWTARESNRVWSAVACSADGTKLVAAVNGGQIYVSSDLGMTWTNRESNRAWYGLASSSDGTKLAAVVNNGFIFTSSDAGNTWSQRGSSAAWYAVACSADGTRLVAVVYGSQIATSTDSGATWSALHGPSGYWGSVASSADGTKLAMASRLGQIYVSNDSGKTWSPHGPSGAWYAIASSADGTRLAAALNGGQVYISSDSGLTWTARENNRAWQSIACSSDGTMFFATVGTGQIYVASPPSVTPATTTTPGANGYILGGQGTAIRLLYIGNNQFLPLSHEGIIQAF